MESKKWYQSKTIWGIIISAIGVLLNKYLGVQGLDLPSSEEYHTLLDQVNKVKDAQGSIMNLATTLMTAFGTLLAIFGRVKAETTIG